MFYVKEIEDGVLKHYIPGLKAKAITLPNNIHTVAQYCFDPYFLDMGSTTLFDDFFTLDNWDDFFELKSITIPQNIKKIERYAFVTIPNLEKFIVEKGNTSFKVYDDVLLTADGTQIIACPEKKYGDFTVPSGVKTIWKSSFSSSRLSRIFLPLGVTTIEESGFNFAHNLEEIYIPSSVVSIGENAFFECSALTIFAPEDSYAIQYAKENNIAYECVDESIVLEKANHIKEEYWISVKKEAGFCRKKKLGYAYEWNGFILYSDLVIPKADTAVTEKNSGMIAPSMEKLQQVDFDKLKQIFEKIRVIDLPIEE